MADSGLVDGALIELLANDPALTALCPGGVYWNLRPATAPPSTAFVIVAHFDSDETPGFGGPLYEGTMYLIRASVLETSRTPARQAAARIHALLQGTILDLSAAGYQAMDLRRRRRVAYEEPDPITKAPWHHHGGHYELMDYPID